MLVTFKVLANNISANLNEIPVITSSIISKGSYLPLEK